MKNVLAFLLVMLLTIGVAAAEGIHLVAPMTGYTQGRIDATMAKDEADRGAEEKWHMLINEGMATDYPEYEMECVDWGWAESLDQKQRPLISAGMAPDILAGETFMPTYAAEGLLEPLPEDIVDLVNPTFLLFDREGTLVGVGVKSAIFPLFYNKDLMAAASLDPETPRTTWDEWKEMSDAITAAGNGEFYGGGISSFLHTVISFIVGLALNVGRRGRDFFWSMILTAEEGLRLPPVFAYPAGICFVIILFCVFLVRLKRQRQ